MPAEAPDSQPRSMLGAADAGARRYRPPSIFRLRWFWAIGPYG